MGRTFLRIDAGAWSYASHFKSRCLSLLPRTCTGIAAGTIGRPKNALGKGRPPHAGHLLRFHFSRKLHVTRADSKGFVTISGPLASNEHVQVQSAKFCRTCEKRCQFGSPQLTHRVWALLVYPGSRRGAQRNSVPRKNDKKRASCVSAFIRKELVWTDLKICLRIGVDESAGVRRRQE